MAPTNSTRRRTPVAEAACDQRRRPGVAGAGPPGSDSPRPLIWIPRYWPALGGSELHSRRLAHELGETTAVTVLTHSSDSELPLPRAAALATACRLEDGPTTICRTGLPPGPASIMAGLAWAQQWLKPLRPLHARVFRRCFSEQAEAIATRSDLIHVVYNGLTESVELAADIAARQRKPFVWSPLACTDGRPGRGWSSARFRRLYARADALIALTNHEREWLISVGAAAERTHVVPFGPLVTRSSDAERFRLRHGIDDAPLVLYLGRVNQDKGAHLLASAAPLVWRRYPEARVLFVGPVDAVTGRVFNRLNDPRLISLEKLSQAEKCAALEAAQLMALPSHRESLGVAYLEAWHFGKPVIAQDLPVLREVIAHGRDGLLCEASAQATADAVIRLLADPARARAMGEAGRRKVQDRFCWPDIVQRVEQIYRQVTLELSSRHRSSGRSFATQGSSG